VSAVVSVVGLAGFIALPPVVAVESAVFVAVMESVLAIVVVGAHGSVVHEFVGWVASGVAEVSGVTLAESVAVGCVVGAGS